MTTSQQKRRKQAFGSDTYLQDVDTLKLFRKLLGKILAAWRLHFAQVVL